MTRGIALRAVVAQAPLTLRLWASDGFIPHFPLLLTEVGEIRIRMSNRNAVKLV